MNKKVLLVDDDRPFTEQIGSLLDGEGYKIDSENISANVLQRLKTGSYAVVLLDIQMPDPDGLTLLNNIRQLKSPPEIIMCSGQASLQEAADSIKNGASDFLEKPPDVKRLLVVIKSAMEKYNLRQENRRFREEKLSRYEIIGESEQIVKLRHTIESVSATDSRVLIWGETGTGKELVASQIHYRSARSSQPLVTVNCAAIPHDLAESELFGHKKGAFTGAISDRHGKFKQADGGSLVLDEIAELPLALQSKLLRLLESNELEMIGSDKKVEIDVRLISISGKDLEEQAKQEKFRADLLYRINTIPIYVAPLRERKEDIPLLFHHFFNRLKESTYQFERTYESDIITLLNSHDWPGNIRELRNFTERLFFICDRDEINRDFASKLMSSGDHATDEDQFSEKNILKRNVAGFEKNFLKINLRQSGGNISELARKLGMDRGNLYKKLKKYKLL